jgi:predicted molibdopterin-dependent oxidoreductase YjgC
VLLWGTNTLTANPHLWPFVLRARERGARIVAIDPLCTRTAAQCDDWIPIRPGTDAALALGMMHVLFARGLEDRDYLERYTLGHGALRERAAEWTPARTSAVTGLSEERIIALGEEYGRARAAFIRPPSIHSRSDGAHTIAPTWHLKRSSPSSDRASHVGAPSSASQSSVPTASGARRRNRRPQRTRPNRVG